jgi:hypothetical protein
MLPAPPPAPPVPAPATATGARCALRYLARTPVVLRGAATGIEYRFDAQRAERLVDVRDAEALLRTPFFRRAD